MKINKISMLSAIVIFVLLLGVLPAVAGESPDGIKSSNTGDLRPVESPLISQKSAIKSEYTLLTAQVGESLIFSLAASDPDNNPLIYSASNLPPGATFDPLTGAFSWTPGYGQAGVYPGIHFEVSDGELTDSEDITITVTAASDGTAKTGAAVFSVSALSINPKKVNIDKKVNIRVTATNSGNAAGDYEVTLRINGSIEAVNLVSLPPDVSITVSFTTIQSASGIYEVDVNGLSGSFVVNAPKEPPGRKFKL